MSNNNMILGYLIEPFGTLCALCSINEQDADPQETQPLYAVGYPDGFTCDRCWSNVRNPFTQDTPNLDEMARTSSSNIGAQICQSLGLDPYDVVGFTLEFRAGALPNLTVIHQAWEPNLEAFARTLNNYTLLPKP